MIEDKTKTQIEQLNSMLRGELSAIETYEQCIEKMDEPVLKQQLASLRSSHVTRATKLSTKIRSLGGEPQEGSGAWGAFAKLVEGSAKVFGKKAAISVLEEGEDKGLADYTDVEHLSPSLRHFVQSELLPEQRRTHDALNRIQRAV